MLKDMTEHFDFSIEERDKALALYTELKDKIAASLEEEDEGRIRSHLLHAIEQNKVKRDIFGLNPIISSLQTALDIEKHLSMWIDSITTSKDAPTSFKFPSEDAAKLKE